MSAAHPRRTSGVDWRRAEFVLTLLAFVGFITLPIRITTIYSGLPAHPLFIHVPVVLIPLSVLGALACVARPSWFSRYGILLCLTAIVGMSSIFLAMQAGAALEGALNLQGPAAALIHRHSHAAHLLAYVFIVFTATLILTFSAHRISGGRPTGLSLADRVLGSRTAYHALRVGLVVLALVSTYLVYKVGDLGAKAVWEGRIQAAAGHGFPGGPPGGGYPAP
jgi:hypothetical protein